MSRKPTYDLISLESYSDSLTSFPKTNRQKIENKVADMLQMNPKRYSMLKGKIKIRGMSFAGLRHMKVGIEGSKGGAYILYRICEECKRNRYYEKSDAKCEFCDDEKEDNRIVLFLARLRSFGY